MSELTNTQNSERYIRRYLLTTVSALALLASVGTRNAGATDEDADRPTIWIELGGQLEHMEGQGDPLTPGFLAMNPNSPVLTPVSPVRAQNAEPFGFTEDSKISFQPEDSNWVFSGGVRFGRSSNRREVHHQTSKVHYKYNSAGVRNTSQYPVTKEDFASTQVHHQESHLILDFMAGKDVGFGMFGVGASSTISLGVRFAQFTSKETVDIRARPDVQFKYFPSATKPQHIFPYFHSYHATGNASRSFHGVGPSLSWDGSAPIAGNLKSGEFSFDWGANMALLFGRQKARARDQKTGVYASKLAFNHSHYVTPPYTVTYQHPGGHIIDRSVIVPNVGGMAGASWRIDNVKVSFGYRADFFFGAMDVGIDARKSATLGFYGPFASVSVGLGG
jgi:iron complex outermembrane receptor protein